MRYADLRMLKVLGASAPQFELPRLQHARALEWRSVPRHPAELMCGFGEFQVLALDHRKT